MFNRAFGQGPSHRYISEFFIQDIVNISRKDTKPRNYNINKRMYFRNTKLFVILRSRELHKPF